VVDFQSLNSKKKKMDSLEQEFDQQWECTLRREEGRMVELSSLAILLALLVLPWVWKPDLALLLRRLNQLPAAARAASGLC